jgi:membrane-bound lytic murein transglycosylase F
MKLFVFILTASLLFSLAACRSSSGDKALEAQDDQLKRKIEERIAEKKELDLLASRLTTGRIGKSIIKYKPVIKKYAKRYGFDWRLIAAQIVQESGFKVEARSRVGALGLMQIMPRTAREISRELDIEYIMKNPRENITAGIYHLKKQFRLFPDAKIADRTKLALASYNCGVGRVFDAQKIARYYKLPSNKWKNVRPYMAMLKKSDWQLHLQVWPKGKPKHGYFYGYNETINYVDNIWRLYLAYQKIM